MKIWSARRDVPSWAWFFGHEDYDAFVQAVSDDLSRRSDQVWIGDGVAAIELDARQHRFGLLNLAQLCNLSHRDGWPDLIRRHFDGIIRTAGGTDLEALSSSFEAARHRLKVRIYASDLFEGRLEGAPVWRPVADGLVAALVYDLPDAVVTVSRHTLARWPVTVDEAFDIAMSNVLREDPMDAEPVGSSAEGEVFVLEGPSFFVSSHLLVLEQHLDPAPRCGALVCIPDRHTLLFSPIHDMSVLDAMNTMVSIGERRFAHGPGSIRPTVYWWRDGELVPLPAAVEQDAIRLDPPRDFVEGCLRLLARSDGTFGPN